MSLFLFEGVAEIMVYLSDKTVREAYSKITVPVFLFFSKAGIFFFGLSIKGFLLLLSTIFCFAQLLAVTSSLYLPELNWTIRTYEVKELP